jgi:hypothetical protein
VRLGLRVAQETDIAEIHLSDVAGLSLDPANHLGRLSGPEGLHQSPNSGFTGAQAGVALLQQGPDGARLAAGLQQLGDLRPMSFQAGLVGRAAGVLALARRLRQPFQPPLDLVAGYVLNAGVGAIVWWLAQESPSTPEPTG